MRKVSVDSIVFISKPNTSSISVNIKGINDITKLQLLLKDINDFIVNIDNYFLKLSHKYITNLLVTFSEIYSNIKFFNSWEYLSYKIRNNVYDTDKAPDAFNNSEV